MNTSDLDAFIRRWVRLLNLDRRMWGLYRYNNRRRPLCVECYQRSRYKIDVGNGILWLCEQHAARFYMHIYERIWHIAEQLVEEDEQE